LRPLELNEKKVLYKFTKTVLIIAGAFLVGYGAYLMINGLVLDPSNQQYLFGLFPAYIGGMMILLSLAMRIEWFTDARRFW
jgi:hypothetical protein